MRSNPEDSAMTRSHAALGVVGAVLCFAAYSLFGLHEALSVAVGAGIASINLFVLSRSVEKMVQGRSASWAGVALLKFVVLLSLVYGLINAQWVESLALAVGFGALPLGILLAGTTGPSLDDESHHSGPTGSFAAKIDNA